MSPEQSPQFILEARLTVVLLLPGNVLLDLFQVGSANRKIRIPALPLEIRHVEHRPAPNARSSANHMTSHPWIGIGARGRELVGSDLSEGTDRVTRITIGAECLRMGRYALLLEDQVGVGP